jgi:small-conductance mechanosensitive channel
VYEQYESLSPQGRRLVQSFLILFCLTLARFLANFIVRRRLSDVKRAYRCRRGILYVYTFLLVFMIGSVWVEGIQSLSTMVGLASAGIAIAMHDTIANIAGWLFIISLKPFRVGDRIQIAETSGDVIDIGFFQFSMVEIRNWVDADQSTGRIVHVPNSKVLREPLANYVIGFEYIWHEVPVLITFESDWKRAKQILEQIAADNLGHLSSGAQEQIRRAAEKYLIYCGTLTPIVYTTVRNSGVLLTLRYLVNPRRRRGSEQEVWEAILTAFAAEPQVELAYPTTRFYSQAAGVTQSKPGEEPQL